MGARTAIHPFAARMTLEAHKQSLLADDNEQRTTAFMEEAPDKRALAKQDRVDLEAQALDDIASGRSEATREHHFERGRSAGRGRPQGKASFQRSQSRSRSRSSSRSGSVDGFGRDNSKRSTLAKWLSCFKTPRSALSHKPEDKNTSCTPERGTTRRLRRLWK